VRNTKHWLLSAALAALLVLAVWYCASVWQATSPIPLYRNVILVAAAILMFVIGSGLTALMFYSRRKGYDQPARSDRRPRE